MPKLFLFYFLFFVLLTFSQTNLKADMRKQNPIKENSTLNDFEKIKIHEQFLTQAIEEKNSTHQFYGHLYLLNDYFFTSNYIKMNKCLIDAEQIANETKNQSWKGAINVRKAMLFGVKQNKEAALKHYFLAYDNCKIAKDSLCMGECLEQISAKYKELEDLKKAREYYQKAIPILSKFGDNFQMALTYNNYSNLLGQEGDFVASEKYIDSAIIMAKKNKDLYKVTLYNLNKASLLTTLKKYPKAIKLYQEGEKISQENNWGDLLAYNFSAQSELYEEIGTIDLAYNYLNKYNKINDSLNGIKVQNKISELEIKYETQKKEASLKEASLKISESNRKIERIYFLLSVLACLIGVLLYFYFNQKKKLKKELELNQQRLLDTKLVLIQKNELLNKKEKELELLFEKNKIVNEIKSFDLQNLRILTESDWVSFKNYFNKINPNYLKKLRNIFPKITEAEERLFLCLKLNMKSKEIAAVLGISPESVKKNRNRLRKKINLNIEDDLQEFINNF